MSPKTPLKYLLNPCDLDRHKVLEYLGDGIAAVWRGFTAGTECPCCLGTRLIAGLALAFLAGALLF